MTKIDIIPGPIVVTFTILYFIYLNESPMTEIRNQIQVKCENLAFVGRIPELVKSDNVLDDP